MNISPKTVLISGHFSFYLPKNRLFPSLSPLPSSSLPSLLCICVARASLLCLMPKLKLTYLQIKEQIARDIRHRTEARKAQLLQPPLLLEPTFSHKATQTEDFEETDSEGEEDTDPIRFSYIPQLFFLVLLLCFLLYHAGKQT